MSSLILNEGKIRFPSKERVNFLLMTTHSYMHYQTGIDHRSWHWIW